MEDIEEIYGVYKILSGDEDTGQWGICRKEEFSKQNLCECFDHNGQEIGCTDAGCNTPDNSYHLQDCATMEDKNEYFDSCEDCPLYRACPEGDEHVEVIANSFWNGSNWKSLVLEADHCTPDVQEEETELSEKLLGLWDGISFDTNAPTDTQIVDGYKFTHSNYSSSAPFLCQIQEL